ncbi:alpha-2-macroglobulin-like protein 1 [Watersipora subatra]|uniref:alpha-2-macroglobulin-like protein 1 n=1 Tax=Watersipora subatra TaxID=2589382 RepID=UPI00355AD33D
MNYRHDDGSYSAFGPGREEGSIWLTAFVVKCFAQASAYIYIDPRLQQESIEYFESKQNSNGCFPQVGLVHSKYMQGGMGRRQDSTALTAYILISMLEAGMDASNDTVNKAWQCLFIQPLTNNYTLALVTYAMSLVDSDHPDTMTLYDQLLDAAIQGCFEWLIRNDIHRLQNIGLAAGDEVEVSSSEEDGDGTWWYQPKSADVETTSYALLALLQMTKSDAEKVSLGLPIVKWLSQQRNSYGGFGSTQDTVIGLQALAKYASYLYTDELDIAVSVRFNDSLIPFTTFLVQAENSLVQQSETMSRLAPISVMSTGVGCFLFQAHVKYNVFADLLRKSAFSISIDDFASDLSNNPCKRRKLNICTRYEGSGLSTNMAVIKVSMVSGWAADPAELKSLLTNRRVQLKRYDVEKNNAVQLYFDQISRIRLCFNIEIQRVMEIDDAKPAVVTVYDYYQKELSSDAEYSILSDFCSVSDRPSTKEDLPVISWEEFENSISQARQPMSLRPPKRTLSPFIELPTTVNCPVCHKSTEEFIVSSSICDYKKAYKVSWRAKANYRLTVMANLRPSGRTKFRKRHINYALPQNCSCITLFSAVAKDKLLILGDWEKEIKNGETILINGESTVLPLTKAVEKQINTVTKQCLN